jgi:hypothetical protein
MNRKTPFAALVLSTCVTLSCSEDGLTDLAGDLVGTWNLTKAEFTNAADTTQREDLIQLGWVVTIEFQSNGRFIRCRSGSGHPDNVECRAQPRRRPG